MLIYAIKQQHSSRTAPNDKTLVEYTEPDDLACEEGMIGRFLDSGTFALQAHDPDSRVYFRNIRVKPLRD